MTTNRLSIVFSAAFLSLLAMSCSEDVLTFPELEPARIRIVNVAPGIESLQFVIDSSIVLNVPFSEISPSTAIPSGRPIPFVINVNGRPASRDTSRFTFGTSGASFLATISLTPGNYSIVSPIRDTILPANVPNGYVKFLHGVSDDRFFEVEVYYTQEEPLFASRTFDPYSSSPNFAQLSPGTYTFYLREAGSSTEFARLENVRIDAGRSYLLYSHPSSAGDGINLKIQ